MALTLEEERELSQLEKDFESQDISLEPSPNLTVEEQQELLELETEFSQADANPASPTGLTLEEQDEMSQLESEFGSEEPSTGDIVKGVGTEIAVGVGGQLAGTAIGTAILPGVGTAIGYTIGSIGSGIAGSIAAQKIEGQEDISWGRAIAAGLINLAPGGSAKGVKGATKITGSMVGKAAAKEAVKGAAFGATEATSRAIIDEGRLPTKEELAQYGGAGALFGGALGAATPKVSKTFDKFFGKTAQQIDDDIIAGVITPKELKELQPNMSDGDILKTIQAAQAKARSDAAADVLLGDTPFQRMKDRFLSIVAPSKVVGKEARNEILRFRKRITSIEEIGGKWDKRVANAIARDPTVEGKVNRFIAGERLSDAEWKSLGSLTDEMVIYRDTLDELQAETLKFLDEDFMAKMGPEKLARVTDKILDLKEKAGQAATKSERRALAKKLISANKKKHKLESHSRLVKKIQESRDLKNFSRKEYRMFLDGDFVPDVKLRARAQEEIADKMLANGRFKDLGAVEAKAAAMKKADARLNKLEGRSAAARKLDKNQGTGRKYDAPLKKRTNPGPMESQWLGEVTDTGERMRGTLTGVGRMVAREKTDANILKILKRNGLAIQGEKSPQGTVKLKLRAGVETGYHVTPEVQASINSLYMNGGIERSNNVIIAGLQDLYSTAVGLSKATKVLLNPPSYAVQVFGNGITLLGGGTNPFAGSGRGLRLALSEFGGLEKLLSPSGKIERRAFLREVNDMARYGIKGENILESDMRDSFERGMFAKAAEKPVGFFGKAYSVPDTVGRYVGWKAQQKMLNKIYPHLDDESVKRLAADIINDTYQNYDRLSEVIKRLSRLGVMPQFASFTAEFMRNQYNQAKIIKQMLGGTFGADLGIDISKAKIGAMRIEGAKRLAALSTVYGGTAAGIAAINHDGGVNDENQESLQNSVPEWDRNKTLAMRLSEDGRKLSYANVSYISPHALGLAAVEAAMSDEPLDNLASILVEEFVGEGSFINRGLMEAVNNQNSRNKPISYSENDYVNAKERLTHFVKESFRPGIAREAKKMEEALRGLGDLTTTQVLLRQVGYRVNTVDLEESAMFAMKDYKANADGSRQNYKKARDYGNLRPEDLEGVYQQANAARRESMDKIAEKNRDLTTQGFSEEERIQVMRDAKISTKDILATINGEYNDILRADTETSTDIYESLPEDMNQKRRAINEKMRSTPEMGKRLMAMWKKEQRQARKGLTPQQELFSRLGTEDKVTFLRSKRGLVESYRRKGLINEQVIRALAITE